MLLIGYRSARPARWPMPSKLCMHPTQPVVQNCQTSLADGLAVLIEQSMQALALNSFCTACRIAN
eukprot:14202223-Heterocapsa_arctica.AAC.1